MKDESLNLEGRLHDGWKIALRVRGSGGVETVLVCDYASPESTWARIQDAKRKPGATVAFSGCRAEANGKIDGWAVFSADDVVGIANWGGCVLGAVGLEGRIQRLESALEEAVVQINDLSEEVFVEEAESPISLDAAAALVARDDEE